jgi:exodeoxyribonuclease V alpha subunit
MELHPKQREAIESCCDVSKRIVAVTGPAGTGKTTILKLAFDAAREAGWNPGLCAPTGKAAKRIFEATGIDAMTVHRLLEYNHPGDPDPKTGKPYGVSAPRRNRSNPLDFDMIFVDEYAMVNHEVHASLLAAIPNGGNLRVFGDDNQLAPIEEDEKLKGEPSPFLKLLQKKEFTAIYLDQVFRQGQDSGILLNANSILKGRYPTNNEQWTQKYTDSPVKDLQAYVLDQLFENEISYASTENQIIVPQNTSWVGTTALNTMLQGLFHNESEPSLKLDRKPWHVGEGGKKGKDGGFIKCFVGDKVICQDNLYDLGVFNGECGIVIEANTETGEVVVDFGDREQCFPPIMLVQNQHGGMSEIDPRKSLALGYAITTHKSQGSEYKRVVYIANKSNTYMLNRRNLYTAITRAREHVLFLADQKGMAAACGKKG